MGPTVDLYLRSGLASSSPGRHLVIFIESTVFLSSPLPRPPRRHVLAVHSQPCWARNTLPNVSPPPPAAALPGPSPASPHTPCCCHHRRPPAARAPIVEVPVECARPASPRAPLLTPVALAPTTVAQLPPAVAAALATTAAALAGRAPRSTFVYTGRRLRHKPRRRLTKHEHLYEQSRHSRSSWTQSTVLH